MNWPADALLNKLAKRTAEGDPEAAKQLLKVCGHLLGDAARRDVPGVDRADLLAELRAALVVTSPRAWVRGGCKGDFAATARVILRRCWFDLLKRSKRQAGFRQLMRHITTTQHDEPQCRRLWHAETPVQLAIEREQIALAAGLIFDNSEPRPGFMSNTRAAVPLLLLGMNTQEVANKLATTIGTLQGGFKRMRTRAGVANEVTTIVAYRHGEQFGTWATAREAAKAVGLSEATISEAINNRRQAKGITFRRRVEISAQAE